MATQTKQALFLKTKNIGDSIILTASISALPKDYRYVDIICFPESAPIFEMNKRVRNIFIIPRDKKGIKKIAAYISLFKKIFGTNNDDSEKDNLSEYNVPKPENLAIDDLFTFNFKFSFSNKGISRSKN